MEEKDYYYLKGETRMGPFSLEALKSESLTSSTLVWNSSLPDWVAAGTLPELQSLFAPEVAATPPPQPTMAYGSPSNTFGPAAAMPPMPDNYLVWAILTTILCCLPLGIVSIINATKVSSTYGAGDYEGAKTASAAAKKWATWSAIAGVIYWVICIITFVILAAAGIALENSEF
ncbi:MAG: CD225/dispanin family protein [Tannerella sp.]|jgi:hypothetical protein|nr:CD225/dispanin family protein [Tannerella sp.]